MVMTRLSEALAAEKERIKRVQERNSRIFRENPWAEISGSFGDIGTFLPIFLALAPDHNGDGHRNLISPASTLVFSGLFNILTGLFFGIPLPVQPMKAIAAVAIGSPYGWTQAKYASAGLFVAAVVGFLSVTGLIEWFSRRVPIPIVKGIQVGAGISLMMSGFDKIYSRFVPSSWQYGWDRPIQAFFMILPLLLLLLICSTRPRVQFVLVIMVVTTVVPIIGILVSVITHDYIPGDTSFSIWRPSIILPDPGEFAYGAFNAGLGQVPLTTLNSVVAVVYLAQDLLPDAPQPSATGIGISVALMNLVGCWFKAMPVCHGSGGLAAQYRFGARSGASVIFLGTLKILLGLFASQWVSEWSAGMPDVILGMLLILAGVALVRMGENVNSKGAKDLWKQNGNGSLSPERRQFVPPDATQRTRRYLVMLVTIGAILGTKNDGIGFIVGLLVHYGYKLQDWEKERRARNLEGQIRLEADASIVHEDSSDS